MESRTEKGTERKEGAVEAPAAVVRKNMLWNVAGSVAFIGAQWLMTILIVHLADYSAAGYFALGLSLTNVFTNLSYFCIRNFQVSDTSGKYSADIYVTHRLLASIAAFALYGLFVLANGYPLSVTVFLCLFMLYRLSEPIADVFHGIDQKAWRLDIAGASFLLRGILMLLVFIVAESVSGSLSVTTFAMLAAVYLVIALFDIPRSRCLQPFALRWDKNALLSLTRECLPLFAYAVCLNAVVPITRYFLERIAGSETLGYYSSAAIPASVIQLLASYIFTTFTALFSAYRREGEKKKFLRLFWRLTAALAGLTAFALLCCALLGEWALTLLFTERIRPYAYLLLPTVFCCGVIAMIWFLGMILTILRDGRGMLAGALAGMLVAAGLSAPCILWFGVDGVNAALFAASMATLLIFGYRFWRHIQSWEDPGSSLV